MAKDPPIRPAPVVVACPSCGAEHDGRYEDRWEDDDERTHDIHRCPCGAVRLDGVWHVRADGKGGDAHPPHSDPQGDAQVDDDR